MRDADFAIAPVDTTRLHFEVVHSLFKETCARVGWNRAGSGLAVEFLVGEDPQAETVHIEVLVDLRGKLKRCGGDSAVAVLAALMDGCRHPNNLYTRVHWFPIDPGCHLDGVGQVAT